MSYHIVPWLGTSGHLVTRMVLCLVYYLCPLSPPPNLMRSILPDLYNARFSKDLSMSLGILQTSRNHWKMACLWTWQVVRPLSTVLGCYMQYTFNNVVDILPHCGTNVPPGKPGCYYFHYIMYAPCLFDITLGVTSHGYNWIPTAGCLPCQVQLGSAHGPWHPPAGRWYREM